MIMKAQFKLNVTEKKGKFHYTVTDQNNNIISERKSTRNYVACTADGTYYFGRLDLIGKGEHGSRLNNCESMMRLTEEEFNKKYKNSIYYDFQRDVESAKNTIERLNSIAYL